MKNSTSRILIETMVKKTLREMKDAPERSVRNLVDMALQFSEGRFQKNFFSVAQTMLQNRKSPYYGLIQDVISNVDTAWILGFGMNVGYNSCTAGARRIREIEEKEHFNIPWSVVLTAGSGVDYQPVIAEGQSLGIFTWILIAQEKPHEVLQLVEAFPDSAFILLSEPEDYTVSFLDQAMDLPNLMLTVRFEESSAACHLLRSRGIPYSVFHIYDEENVTDILDGELFSSMEPQHPLFAVLLAHEKCPVSVRETVYEYVKKTRDEQAFQLIPWEMAYDSCLIDSIISSEACSAGFDQEGTLHTTYDDCVRTECNLHQLSLGEILRKAFPKSQEGVCSEEE